MVFSVFKTNIKLLAPASVKSTSFSFSMTKKKSNTYPHQMVKSTHKICHLIPDECKSKVTVHIIVQNSNVFWALISMPLKSVFPRNNQHSFNNTDFKTVSLYLEFCQNFLSIIQPSSCSDI